MLHPHDEQSLQRLLGRSDIPQDVRDEYAIRIQMYHGDGNSGPLRTLALIELVRSLGHAPPARVAVGAKIDWRQYPQNGSVRIEARFFGSWIPGQFLGFVEHGMLAVRLDDDPLVRECRQDMVRMATSDEPSPLVVSSLDEDDSDPNARLSLWEKPELPPTGVCHDAEEVEKTEPRQLPPCNPLALPDHYDWSVAAGGAPVWVDDGDDVKDAVFLRVIEGGSILVELDGEETMFLPERVTFAGDAA